jgi:hypothetical protein
MQVIEVRPLTNAERFAIVQQVPLLSAKSLDPKQVQRLLSNPATTNPLYLLVALEELRGFGSFEQLNRRIELFPQEGDTVTALFSQVIERLQSEFDDETVRSVLSLLASARRGLSDRELLDLIEGPTVPIEASTSDLFPVLRQLRAYLQHRGDLWDFFHQNLVKAVRESLLPDETTTIAAHRRLAGYFAAQPNWPVPAGVSTPAVPHFRKVDELPWQWLQAPRGTHSKGHCVTLTSSKQNASPKCCTSYWATCTMPWSRYQRVRKDSSANATGDSDWLRTALRWLRLAVTVQERCALFPSRPTHRRSNNGGGMSCKGCLGGATTSFTPAERLRSFEQFLDTYAFVVKLAPAEVATLARNQADSGPVADAAAFVCDRLRRVWTKQIDRTPPPPLDPACVRTLYGHRSAINCLAISGDAGLVASACMYEPGFLLWDLSSGRQIARIGAPTVKHITRISIGELGAVVAATTLVPWKLHLWDLHTKDMMRVISIPSSITCLALTSDEQRAVTGRKGAIDIWDVHTGECIRTIPGPELTSIHSLALNAAATLCASAGEDGCVRLWDMETGFEVRRIDAHAGAALAIAMTTSGDRLISFGQDRILRAWRLPDGTLEQTICIDGGLGLPFGPPPDPRSQLPRMDAWRCSSKNKTN